MFKFITFATLAALAQAFQLQAVAIDAGAATGSVTYDDNGLGFDGDKVADINLEQPSGFATVGGKYLLITTDQIKFVDSISDGSKDWGVVDGKFRSGPSSDNTKFYSCGDNKVLSKILMDGCLELQLNVVGENAGGDIIEPSSVEEVATSSTQEVVTSSIQDTVTTSSVVEKTTLVLSEAEASTSTEATSSEVSTSTEIKSSEAPQVTYIENNGNRLANGLGVIGVAGVALLM